MHLQLTLRLRLLQVLLELVTISGAAEVLRPEDDVGAAAGAFCFIKGQVGVLHELLGIGTVNGCQRDADARSGSDLVPEQVVRLGKRAHQALSQLGRVGFAHGARL